ncbi:MAG: DUF3341 domain-containing protein [Candidatus Eisenbacteria bacterium]|nr:DUF3341 domain-containing protein [Candidatus Latescibacterota bacterium]MBD3302249.1 DUF3341 domain-containing protein [Candidatus Eisenbacteria bacterium]
MIRDGDDRRLYGLAVEFDSVNALLQACASVRDAGFKKWDAYTPFPVHGLNDAMGIKHSRLPILVLMAGATGAGLGLLMQWWMNAVDYKFIISGKPFFGLPATIPITFELTILLAATSAFLGMLAFNSLPMYHHPIFASRLHKRATSDRFVICIEAEDPRFDDRKTEEFLAALGGTEIERVWRERR